MTASYHDKLVIKDALQIYFSKYHFKDGGYTNKWFRIKMGPFFMPLPNIKARVDAVKIHDIHHVITEYPANYRGEVQIGGWELAGGCGTFYMAWILNFGSFFIGMIAFPKALLQAFLHGRRCSRNLYYNITYNAELLNKTVGELRATVLKHNKENSFSDYLLFTFYCLIALFYPASLLILIWLVCRLSGI